MDFFPFCFSFAVFIRSSLMLAYNILNDSCFRVYLKKNYVHSALIRAQPFFGGTLFY